MTRKLKITSVLLLLCMACTNVKETPKGLTYTVVRAGNGTVAKPGEYLIANLFFKDAKDSVWFDSRKSEFPAPVMIPDTSMMKREDAIADLFRHLSKGDSVTFEMPAEELFAKTFKQPMPPKVDPKGKFLFAIGIKDVLNQDQFTKLQKEVNEKQVAKINRDKVAQLGKDTVKIDSFLTVKNIKAMKTASGLRYVVVKEGKGPKAQPGQTVKVLYAGYLMNGKYFDTNVESIGKSHGLNRARFVPMEVRTGPGTQMIAGFDESFMLMNKGERLTVYVPSTLAYGPRQISEIVGHNSILIFDIEMLDITNGPPALKK